MTSAFCPVCGSPVFKQSAGYPQFIVFHAATLDDPSQFRALRSIWPEPATLGHGHRGNPTESPWLRRPYRPHGSEMIESVGWRTSPTVTVRREAMRSARRRSDRWEVAGVGAPDIGERSKKAKLTCSPRKS